MLDCCQNDDGRAHARLQVSVVAIGRRPHSYQAGINVVPVLSPSLTPFAMDCTLGE
jgi:hypothetical protein